MITTIDNRPVLYFAVYVDVGSKSPQRAKEELSKLSEVLHQDDKTSPYREKFFILPVRSQETRMELLYPSPFISKEDADELYNKYYDKYSNLLNNIKNLD